MPDKLQSALQELYNSEESYVESLELWSVQFREIVDRTPFIIKMHKDEIICNVFKNVDAILNLHTEILRELRKEKEKNSDINYHEIYLNNLERFSIYISYVSNIKRADQSLSRIISRNNYFKNQVNRFLIDHNSQNLGTYHFINMPSQKIFRYSLLFHSILKRETNEYYKRNLQILIEKFNELCGVLNSEIMKYNNYFEVFNLFDSLKRKNDFYEQVSLDLININRKILKKDEVLVNMGSLVNPNYMQVIVLDNLVLICEQSGDSYYLIKTFRHTSYFVIRDDVVFSRDKNIGKYFIYLVSEDPLKMYFKDSGVRNVWYNYLESAVANAKSKITLKIKITKTEEFKINILFAVDFNQFLNVEKQQSDNTKSIYIPNIKNKEDNMLNVDHSQDHFNENMFSESYIKEQYFNFNIINNKINNFSVFNKEKTIPHIKIEPNRNKKENFVEKFCKRFWGLNINNDIELKKYDTATFNDNSFLVNTFDGLYYHLKNLNIKLIDFSVDKAIIIDISTIIFSKNADLYIFSFNVEIEQDDNIREEKSENSLYLNNNIKSSCIKNFSKNIHVKNLDVTGTQAIQYNINNFFYISIEDVNYILIIIEDVDDYLIKLFSVEDRSKTIFVSLKISLYVSYFVKDVCVINNTIILICDDFYILDINSLNIMEFLQFNDILVNYHFFMCNSPARKVFNLCNDQCLLVFENIALRANLKTRFLASDVISWDGKPIDFNLFERFLIIIFSNKIKIFDISTTDLIFIQDGSYKFIYGGSEIKIHDEKNIYSVEL